MKQLTVICATPPNPNPGMATVDLGFAAMARRAGWPLPIRYVQVVGRDEVRRHRTPGIKEAAMAALQHGLDYAVERDPDRLFGDGAVVFWGDFLHQRVYQQRMAEHLVRVGMYDSVEPAVTLMRRLFLMEGCDAAALGRAVLFGSTLLYNRRLDLRDAAYRTALERLLNGAAGTWFRDAISAAAVERVRGWAGSHHLGIDAALLMDAQQQAQLVAGPWAEEARQATDHIGIFLGRVDRKILASYVKFCEDAANRLKRPSRWIPWWPLSTRRSGPVGRLTGGIRGFQCGRLDRPPSLGDLLEMIQRCALVVTDTYHLAVNAWRMGVPAVCIGFSRSEEPFCSSTGQPFAWSDKRHLFYAMYDALSFYVHREELLDRTLRKQRIEHLADCLADPDLSGSIHRSMMQHAQQTESRVAATIDRLIGKAESA